MKVMLLAYDSCSKSGPFPNLAIMKISNYHKTLGDEVILVGKGLKQNIQQDPDIIYCSCVFDWNRSAALGVRWLYPDAKFVVGGSGIDFTNLPGEIHNMPPDYSIYDDQDVPGWPYGLGFSSRGCNRKCPFCIVPKKEGKIRSDTPLHKIAGIFDKIILLDNNLMQDPEVESKLKWLRDWGGKVNYSQGIDARVIERKPHLAGLLADTKYYSRNFGTKLITLAYDHPSYSKIVSRCCTILKESGFNLRQDVQFFVLTNFNTTFEDDLFRVNHLKELGVAPYLMIYNKNKAPLKLRRLQRWCNARALFWGHDWVDYDRRPLEDDEKLAKVQLSDF